jgi:cobalt-zinc-cadmium efflux system outer membrane protein
LARRRENILEKAAALRSRISRINAGHRVQAGELTEAEGIATEVDSASADELWMRARHDSDLAMERFRMALGLVFEAIKPDVQEQEVSTVEPVSSDALAERAFAMRPDLRAAELGVMAAAKRADWESARIAQLSVLLSSKRIGNNGILTGPGVILEIPVFHRNDGRRERADAEVELATRQYLTLKQRVGFEVREARELLIQAQEALTRIRGKVLPLLEKTVRIAEREHKRRAASYLFVLEQTRNLVDARLRAADAEAGVARAEAQLERAVGGKR